MPFKPLLDSGAKKSNLRKEFRRFQMPLYEYQCEKCSKVHEIMQKFSDAPATECPECKGPLSKLMSLSSFALKGTGWYTTDYKRSGSSEGKKSGDSGA